MNKRLITLVVVVSILIGAAGMVVATTLGLGGTVLLTSVDAENYKNTLRKYSKLSKLLEYVEENYYEPVEEEKLLEGAYAGVFEALDDPYSGYVSSNKAGEYLDSMTLEFGGIGMAFYMNKDGYAFADSVYLNSPADKVGLKAGDVVTHINGESIKGLDSDVVKNMIRGEVGTKVTLTYLRNGVEKTATITRAIIHEVTVSSGVLKELSEEKKYSENLGYIQIAAFGTGTVDEFKQALSDIEAKGVDGLIIDLRNNGGGIVQSAVGVADMLMNKGTVVYAQSQNGSRTYYTTEDGRTELKYVLLVNEYSASATEILAAGVKANNEGLLVGTTTFGKGIIQSASELDDGSVIKMTITQYYDPSGKPIHKVGVKPDYEVELPEPDEEGYIEDTQLLKAIELLK